MMTNGSIGNVVRGVDGQTVTVTYKGGEKKIDIPKNVPVVELDPGNKSEIAPGVMVFVPTDKQADGASGSRAPSCTVRMASFPRCSQSALQLWVEFIFSYTSLLLCRSLRTDSR